MPESVERRAERLERERSDLLDRLGDFVGLRVRMRLYLEALVLAKRAPSREEFVALLREWTGPTKAELVDEEKGRLARRAQLEDGLMTEAAARSGAPCLRRGDQATMRAPVFKEPV